MSVPVRVRLKPQRFPVSWVDALFATRAPQFLCEACVRKLPRGFDKKYEYRPLARFAGAGACEYCGEECIGTLWLPEEQDYWQGHQRIESILHHPDTLQVGAVRRHPQAIGSTDRRRVQSV